MRLLLAALVAAFSCLPALADDGVSCAALPSWLTVLDHAGMVVLGLVPAPYTDQLTLYWRMPDGTVVMAPVGPATDGSGPCVVYERATPIGAYSIGQTS